MKKSIYVLLLCITILDHKQAVPASPPAGTVSGATTPIQLIKTKIPLNTGRPGSTGKYLINTASTLSLSQLPAWFNINIGSQGVTPAQYAFLQNPWQNNSTTAVAADISSVWTTVKNSYLSGFYVLLLALDSGGNIITDLTLAIPAQYRLHILDENYADITGSPATFNASLVQNGTAIAGLLPSNNNVITLSGDSIASATSGSYPLLIPCSVGTLPVGTVSSITTLHQMRQSNQVTTAGIKLTQVPTYFTMSVDSLMEYDFLQNTHGTTGVAADISSVWNAIATNPKYAAGFEMLLLGFDANGNVILDLSKAAPSTFVLYFYTIDSESIPYSYVVFNASSTQNNEPAITSLTLPMSNPNINVSFSNTTTVASGAYPLLVSVEMPTSSSGPQQLTGTLSPSTPIAQLFGNPQVGAATALPTKFQFTLGSAGYDFLQNYSNSSTTVGAGGIATDISSLWQTVQQNYISQVSFLLLGIDSQNNIIKDLIGYMNATSDIPVQLQLHILDANKKEFSGSPVLFNTNSVSSGTAISIPSGGFQDTNLGGGVSQASQAELDASKVTFLADTLVTQFPTTISADGLSNPISPYPTLFTVTLPSVGSAVTIPQLISQQKINNFAATINSIPKYFNINFGPVAYSFLNNPSFDQGDARGNAADISNLWGTVQSQYASGFSMLFLALDKTGKILLDLSNGALVDQFALHILDANNNDIVGSPVTFAATAMDSNVLDVIDLTNAIAIGGFEASAISGTYPLLVKFTVAPTSSSASSNLTVPSSTTIAQLMSQKLLSSVQAPALSKTPESFNITVGTATYTIINNAENFETPAAGQFAANIAPIWKNITPSQLQAGISMVLLALDGSGNIITQITSTQTPATFALHILDVQNNEISGSPIIIDPSLVSSGTQITGASADAMSISGDIGGSATSVQYPGMIQAALSSGAATGGAVPGSQALPNSQMLVTQSNISSAQKLSAVVSVPFGQKLSYFNLSPNFGSQYSECMLSASTLQSINAALQSGEPVVVALVIQNAGTSYQASMLAYNSKGTYVGGDKFSPLYAYSGTSQNSFQVTQNIIPSTQAFTGLWSSSTISTAVSSDPNVTASVASSQYLTQSGSGFNVYYVVLQLQSKPENAKLSVASLSNACNLARAIGPVASSAELSQAARALSLARAIHE